MGLESVGIETYETHRCWQVARKYEEQVRTRAGAVRILRQVFDYLSIGQVSSGHGQP